MVIMDLLIGVSDFEIGLLAGFVAGWFAAAVLVYVWSSFVASS